MFCQEPDIYFAGNARIAGGGVPLASLADYIPTIIVAIIPQLTDTQKGVKPFSDRAVLAF